MDSNLKRLYYIIMLDDDKKMSMSQQYDIE